MKSRNKTKFSSETGRHLHTPSSKKKKHSDRLPTLPAHSQHPGGGCLTGVFIQQLWPHYSTKAFCILSPSSPAPLWNTSSSSSPYSASLWEPEISPNSTPHLAQKQPREPRRLLSPASKPRVPLCRVSLVFCCPGSMSLSTTGENQPLTSVCHFRDATILTPAFGKSSSSVSPPPGLPGSHFTH